MANVLIYFPHATERYDNATGIEVKDGCITLYWKAESAKEGKKITTNAVFRIEEDKIGM